MWDSRVNYYSVVKEACSPWRNHTVMTDRYLRKGTADLASRAGLAQTMGMDDGQLSLTADKA